MAQIRCGGSRTQNLATGPMRRRPNLILKRREHHFLVAGAGAGSVMVLGNVIETLATWFTADMRDARALGLASGGRTTAAKSSAMTTSSAGITHRGFLFFI